MSKFEKLILVREERERGIKPDVGKMMPHFQRCGWPLRKPAASYLEHIRHDGDLKVIIQASPRYGGMPFGADILTLLWNFTTALDRNSRTLRFKAGASILHDMNLQPDGRNYRAVMNSFLRAYGCTYFFEWKELVPGKGKRDEFQRGHLWDRLSLWFHEDNKQMILEGEDFENEIVLSEFAWDWLQSTSWFPTAPAYALRQSPGAIQLYFIIASRGPRLRGPGDLCDIPLTGPEGLDQQIGGVTYQGKEGQKDWRWLLKKWLKEIKTAWEGCPAELVNLTDTPYGKAQNRWGWYLRIGWFPQPSRRLPGPR